MKMSEHVQVGRDPKGRPVYAEVLSSDEIVEQLKASPEWQAFKDRFDMSVEGNHTLLGWLYAEKLGDEPGVEDYQRLLKNIIRSGGVVTVRGTTYEFELKEHEPEPALEPEVQRDKNGKPLSQSQIVWGEMARWSQRASSQDIRERRRTDPAFASFYRLNIEREARETPSTQFELAGQSQNTKQATPELIAFAEEYRKTPVERVRQLRSPAFNALGYKKYIENIETALAAGLV
jgi:hypothetical protein